MNNTVGYISVGFACICGSRESEVGIETTKYAERTGARVAVWARSFFKISRQVPWPSLPSIQYVPVSFPDVKCPEREIYHTFRLTLKLRMNVTVSLVPLFAFIVWTGKTLAVPYLHVHRSSTFAAC
jgi:hypothetical protein